MTNPISFELSERDQDLMNAIVCRAEKLYCQLDADFNRLACEMDLTACHVNFCKLDLERLFTADDGNFAHDVAGIARHINHTTGKLDDCFYPRFAAKETVK